MPVRPPHQQLLYSNDVPNDRDIQDITALISCTRNQIRTYITTLTTSSLYDLNSTLQCIRQYSKYRYTLSAARRAPSEVLTEIFYQLLSDDDRDTNHASIAQVCRHWRMVMRPLLPSVGTFVTPRGVTSSSGRTKEALQEFNSFLGSMPQPLTSPFSVVITDPLKHGDLKNPLIEAIFSQSRRMVSLEITLEPSSFAPLTKRLTDQLDALHTLKLTVSGSPGKYSGPLYLFESAKSLRHLELITLMKVLIRFSISQLISYKEHSLGDVNVHHVRQNGPKLKHLQHTRYTPTSTPYCLDHWQWSEDPLILTSLDIKTYNVDANYSRSVDHEWSEGNFDDADEIFSIPFTTLPHLQGIRIRDPDRNPIPSLIHLIRNSLSGPSWALTKIAIYGLRCQPGQLYQLLILTPKLTYLECHDISPVDTLLLSKLTTPLPVPSLDTLIIHNAVNVQDIRTLVINRDAFPSLCQPLRTVRLMYQNPVDTPQRLKELTPGRHTAHPAMEKNIQRLKELANNQGTVAKKGLTIRKESQSVFQRIISPSRQESTREILTSLTELEAVELSDPFMIKLDHIHTLHSFSLLRFNATGPEHSDGTILKRIKSLLCRWMAAFQLQQLLPSLEHPTSSMPKWIMINPHCISLDRLYAYNFPVVGESMTRSVQDIPPTEYDILYGHYRCPRPEEIFWVRKDCSRNIIPSVLS